MPADKPTAAPADAGGGVDLAKARALLADLRSEVADVGYGRVGPESIAAFDALAAEVAALRSASGRNGGGQ